MAEAAALTLSLEEARGIQLAAQGLYDPPTTTPTSDDLHRLITQLGVVQIDTINVVARSQYLVLWSRLGPYTPALLDELLYPQRRTFEYWSHAASLLPMADYPYYRREMHRFTQHLWDSDHTWTQANPHVLDQTREALRVHGPRASADFARPDDGRRAEAWDWFGLKESRRALHVLWTTGEVMVHSRRAGQKVYDLRERVLAEAFPEGVPSDDDLPSREEQRRYFVRRTAEALGVLTPAWLWDYYRLRGPGGGGSGAAARAEARPALDALVHEQVLIPATITGLADVAYVHRDRLPDLQRIRAGDLPRRTTLLSPFDSLIWHRARARALFDYEVCFEAYIVPEKRRYGYYCLAILHAGRLVGRLDAKVERTEHVLRVRAVHLEPGVTVTRALVTGLAQSLRSLARFQQARAITVERTDPEALAAVLRERVEGALPTRTRAPRTAAPAAAAVP